MHAVLDQMDAWHGQKIRQHNLSLAFVYVTGDILLAYCFKETLTFFPWKNSWVFFFFKCGFLLETFLHMSFVFQTAEVVLGVKQCDTDQSMAFSTNVVKCISDTFPVVSISYNSITHIHHRNRLLIKFTINLWLGTFKRCWRNCIHNNAISQLLFFLYSVCC